MDFVVIVQRHGSLEDPHERHGQVDKVCLLPFSLPLVKVPQSSQMLDTAIDGSLAVFMLRVE